jgi:CBS domain-containing protein
VRPFTDVAGGFPTMRRRHVPRTVRVMPHIAAYPAATQERLTTPVSDIMRPGVITMADSASLLQAKRAMVRHGVHAVLIVGEDDGRALGWVSADGLLAWLERDLNALPAAQGITEPARRIDSDATAHDALEALLDSRVSHLVVTSPGSDMPHGVVGAMDLVDLVTHP